MGARAPSALLVLAPDAVKLLRHFGKNHPANEVASAIKKFQSSAAAMDTLSATALASMSTSKDEEMKEEGAFQSRLFKAKRSTQRKSRAREKRTLNKPALHDKANNISKSKPIIQIASPFGAIQVDACNVTTRFPLFARALC